MTQITEQYLDKLYEEWMSEKNSLYLKLKNDKELIHTKDLNLKISVADTILKSVLKYRNIELKAKLKGNL